MGHTINPVSNRLRINSFWKSIWCSYTMINYKYLILADLKFYQLILFLMKSSFFKKSFVVFANWSLLYHNSKCTLFINYYCLTWRFFSKLMKKVSRKFKFLVKYKKRQLKKKRIFLNVRRNHSLIFFRDLKNVSPKRLSFSSLRKKYNHLSNYITFFLSNEKKNKDNLPLFFFNFFMSSNRFFFFFKCKIHSNINFC